MMDSHLILTDDGEYVWFNPKTKCYELVEVYDPERPPEKPSPLQTNIANPRKNISVMETKDLHKVDGTLLEKPLLLETCRTRSCMKPNIWDENQTLKLLDLCTQNKERLTSVRYKKSEVYKDIAMELQKNGHCFSADQCANRMKTLIAKYKEIRDHNSKSGNDHKEWFFFDALADYLGDRPGIIPRAVCSSISLADHSSSAAAQAGSQISANCSSKGTDIKSDITKIKRVCKKNSPRLEMVKWLRDYKKDVAEREERRIALAEEQHRDNKQILTDILDLMRKNSKEGK